MVQKVEKRDGRIVDFDHNLICRAVCKAMNECNELNKEEAHAISLEIRNEISQECLSVDEIQVLVENKLMQKGLANVARAYIIYRHKRDRARKSESNQIISDIIAAKKNDITRENANMNADTPAGMMMKVASERTKEFVDDYLISDDVRALVDANILHIHDKDYYPTKSLTCLQHPVNNILTSGFRAGHGESRAAKRIETAGVLACISLESIQNEMHGGQAIPAFDFYMAPYVKATYIEEVNKIRDLMVNENDEQKEYWEGIRNARIKDYEIKELPNEWGGRGAEIPSSNRIIQMAINNTVKRVHQAMEAFIHNMNTIHSRGGNQVVFSSINYGTDISPEGRCVIRELLNSTYKGVGNNSTAIFPIQIWKKKRGVSYLPEDPNYDLYKLACKVSAKRFFPNFLNLDATFNQHEKWNADDPERYKHEVATMGCADGQEVVTYKHKGRVYVDSFESMWNNMRQHFEVQSQTVEGYEDGLFMDLKDVEIQDGDKFVNCLRIIKNPDNSNWVKITLSNGRVATVTSDHPWYVNNQEKVVITKNLHVGDQIDIVDEQPTSGLSECFDVDMAWFKGFILCDGCYDGQFMSTIGMDEEDILDKYCTILEDKLNVTAYITERRRGKKGNYFELKAHVSEPSVRQFIKELKREFSGIKKCNRHIPSWVFNSSKEIRIAFLAGMVDADGYINANRERAKVQIGSTNKTLALQSMMLAQSLGVPSKVYENHYCKDRPEAVRYRVEFDAFDDLIKFMACEKKKEKYTSSFLPIAIKSGEIVKIEQIGYRGKTSYDVTTNSGYFTLSGIKSHNCRTRVFENRFADSTSVSRGNLSFSTINLPGLALSVKDNEKPIDDFIIKLDNAIEITGKQLYERYKFQCTALAKQFPLLMSGMWVDSEKLSPNDAVEPVLKHGTLGVGFIGLAEALVVLTGKHHGESENSQELGLQIISRMRENVAKLADKYDLNFSVLATPAEGLSGKFTKKDKKIYGIIDGVTDKDYYTNSNHVPVSYKCSATHKAKVEGPYHEMTRGGHIFYVELDGDATHNVEAIMDIVDLMDKYNIGYGSINHNRNRCLKCGYEDASKELKVCPNCKSHEIDKLQRITGYLVGTTDRWNSGKRAELEDRVTHK